jgi:hypothetical protein
MDTLTGDTRTLPGPLLTSACATVATTVIVPFPFQQNYNSPKVIAYLEEGRGVVHSTGNLAQEKSCMFKVIFHLIYGENCKMKSFIA